MGWIIILLCFGGLVLFVALCIDTKPQKVRSNVRNDSIDDLVNQWKKETAELQAENKAWEKEFSSLMGDRAKASGLEKEGKLFEAISEYEQCVEEGISSPRFRIYNYAHDINRLAILYRKTKQINKEIAFLERMIALHQDYSDISKWKIRIAKAKALTQVLDITFPSSPIETLSKKENTIGRLYLEALKELPEFDFYKNKPEYISTSDYLWQNQHLIEKESKEKKALFRLKNKLKEMLSDADLLEKQGNLKRAASIYEEAVHEECFITTPYERLIIIYSKAKLQNEVVRILETAIVFFEKLRDEQAAYVISIAAKHGKSTYCIDKINNKDKIFYYGGVAELYNPYIIVDKWKDRLTKAKLKSK